MHIWHRNYKDKRIDEAEVDREHPSWNIIQGIAEAGFKTDLSIQSHKKTQENKLEISFSSLLIYLKEL